MKLLYRFYEKYTHSSIINFLIRLFVRNTEDKNKWLELCGMKIGKGCHLSCGVTAFPEPFMVELCKEVYISYGVQFLTHDGSLSWIKCKKGLSDHMIEKIGKIKIGEHCFIGANAIIMQNVTIGNDCIVAAGSVVTKSFSDGLVIGGVPARIICSIDEYLERNKNLDDNTCAWSYGKKRAYYEAKDTK